MRKQIKDSFDNIHIKDSKKEQIYYEILRNYDKKGYVSNQKLKSFKKVFDRYVPAIAVFCILIVAFSYYAVATGLFTGTPYISTDKMLAEATAESADATGAASSNTTSAHETGRSATEPQEEAEILNEEYGGNLFTANIYAAIDIGFTHYMVSNTPDDPLLLWSEMQRLSNLPSNIRLLSYSYEGGIINLYFNEALQSYQDSCGGIFQAEAIAATYSSYFGDVTEVKIYSDNNVLSFNGSTIDFENLDVERLNITSIKEIGYGDLID